MRSAECGMGNGEWGMGNENLKNRTKKFALDVIKLVETLPTGRTTANIIGRQLMRSATSVGSNYRAACRAKSPADFIAKMGIVEEESDECLYWLELLVEANIIDQDKTQMLEAEANELLAITISSIKTAKRNKK